jgi:hypothetical protein
MAPSAPSSSTALSPEPTPLPLFNTLAKSLTIRGYLLFEITTNPAWLERPASFRGLALLRLPAAARADTLSRKTAYVGFVSTKCLFARRAGVPRWHILLPWSRLVV